MTEIELNKACKWLRGALPDSFYSNGIGYDDWADNLWDMHQVMRHARYLAMPKDKQETMRGTVMAYEAMRVGSEPLIEVKYEED